MATIPILAPGNTSVPPYLGCMKVQPFFFFQNVVRRNMSRVILTNKIIAHVQNC